MSSDGQHKKTQTIKKMFGKRYILYKSKPEAACALIKKEVLYALAVHVLRYR